MRSLFLALYLFFSFSTLGLAAPPNQHSPWAETLRLRKLINQELKVLHLEPTKPALIHFATEATALNDGARKPTRWSQVGGGLKLSNLQVHLFISQSVPEPVQKQLKSALEQKSKYKFVQASDFLITFAQKTPAALVKAAATKPGLTVEAPTDQPATHQSPQTPTAVLGKKEILSPKKPVLPVGDLREKPPAKPALVNKQLIWAASGAALLLLVLLVTLWLRRQSESPQHDLAQLKDDLPPGSVDFTDIQEASPTEAPSTPATVEPNEPDSLQVTTDLVDLLLAKPDWAKELALIEGPQGLVKLFQLFGELPSRDIFGRHLGKKRIQEIQSKANLTTLSTEEENRLVERLHQGFFAKKLIELRGLAQSTQQPEPPKETAAPIEKPKANFFEEEAALGFLADGSPSEIFRLISQESSLIQSLVLRHYKGDTKVILERLGDQAPPATTATQEITLELLDNIARGLEGRLKELRNTPDPVALSSALSQMEGKTLLDRETFLGRLSDEDPQLAQAARLNFLDVESFGVLERSLLQFAVKPLSAKVIALGIHDAPKKLQEPLLLALEPNVLSTVIHTLRGEAPTEHARSSSKRLLAQAVNEARRIG